jgi:hypothetical protein
VRVSLPLYLIYGTLAYWTPRDPPCAYICVGFVAMASSCAVSGIVTMPWQPTVTRAAPLAHASSPSSYLPSSVWSPHVSPCSASLRRCSLWVHLRATLNHTFIATTGWTASRRWFARAGISKVVGMISTEAGLSVQIAVKKMLWCVSPINVLPTGCQVFPVIIFCLLASISSFISTLQMRSSSRRLTTYISLACNASPMASRGIPSLQHPRGPETESAVSPGRVTRTVRAILNAGWTALLAALSFLPRTSPTPSSATS